MLAVFRKRLFGFRIGRLAVGTLVLLGSFAAALWAIDAIFPSGGSRKPALVAMPPLQPATRISTISAPIAIALSVIRDAVEQQAPRDLAGKRDNPLSDLLGKADIGWTIARGPIAIVGRPEGLTVSTTLNGTLRVTGQIADKVGNVGGALGGLLGPDVGRSLQKLTGKTLDQRADVRSTVTMTSRPIIGTNWRIDPNLNAQVAMGDSALSIAGIKLSVSNEVKPLLDRTVSEQATALANRIRNDPAIELAARREWAKMCRSISLKGVGAEAPDLWLEVRPTSAFAAQPRIDQNAVTLMLGLQAETRISPSETKPNCPFPAQLQIVQPIDRGRVAIGVPIDVPFTEVNRIVDAQLKGRNFPEDNSGAFAMTVLGATIAPSGDRLLISLRVKAREQKNVLRVRRRSDRARLGSAGAGSGQADLAVGRHRARRAVRGRVRAARRRRASGDALSAVGARRQRGGRPQAVRRQCPAKHRGGARRVPRSRAGTAGRCGDYRPAPGCHRIRLEYPAHRRRGRRQRAGRGNIAAEAVTAGPTGLQSLACGRDTRPTHPRLRT